LRGRDRADRVSVLLVEYTMWWTYRVDLEIPWLTRLIEINEDFLVWKAELFKRDVCAMRIRASVVGVESDLWLGHSVGNVFVVHPARFNA
jgi:hypothetical protein